ncbi:MAG: hypothetical protein JWM65_531 [Sphingomonas bacterium]|nr:hypothetical protein [Sphingomonas bacterium]
MRARRAAPGTAGGRAQPDPADGGGFAVAPLAPALLPSCSSSRTPPRAGGKAAVGQARLTATCRPVRALRFAHRRGRSRTFTRTKSRPPFGDRLSPSIRYARELWNVGGGPVREPARRPCRGAALPRSGGRLGTGHLHPDISDGNSPDDPSVRWRGRQVRRLRRRAPHPAYDHRDRQPNGRAGHRRSRR